MSAPPSDDLPELATLLRQRIRAAGGWLPFDDFMALVLYAPGMGYYANAAPKFGRMPARQCAPCLACSSIPPKPHAWPHAGDCFCAATR